MRISKNRGNAPAFPGTESRFGRCLIPSDRGHIHVGGVQKKGYCHSIVGCFFSIRKFNMHDLEVPMTWETSIFFLKERIPNPKLGLTISMFFSIQGVSLLK